jgi:AraC-like DNA-binding protein
MLAPVELRSADPTAFNARASGLELGALALSQMVCSSLELHRTARLIRQGDPEAYQVTITRRGRGGVEQGGSEVSLDGQDLVLYDTSHPFRGWAHGSGSPAEGFMLVFPRSLLSLPASRIRHSTPTRIPGDDCLAAALADLVTGLLSAPHPYSRGDGARLSLVVIDLLAAVVARRLDTAWDPVGEPEEALLASVHALIERRLADPGLSPPSIAATHRFSVRYLHKLFQRAGHGMTVAAWIRARRLERCRRDLADPSLRHLTLQQVANRWGIADPAQFSRAFKAAYGMPPAAYRQLAADCA